MSTSWEGAELFHSSGELQQLSRKLNATSFLSMVRENGLLDDLKNKPRMTAFVPLNAAFNGGSTDSYACGKYVIDSWVGYTPHLEDGEPFISKAGIELKFDIKDGEYFINDQIKSDSVAPNAPLNTCAAVSTASSASRTLGGPSVEE
ncbi:hypothetical protein FPQ18DRAFT_302735 [Pyronema domesticum]|nr:hypothetical protein FPQ18DRAFT_302735 [Pyronema domesticum]